MQAGTSHPPCPARLYGTVLCGSGPPDPDPNNHAREKVVITRNGRAVAHLLPSRRRSPKKVRKAIRRLRELRKETTLGGLDWRELRDIGRK